MSHLRTLALLGALGATSTLEGGCVVPDVEPAQVTIKSHLDGAGKMYTAAPNVGRMDGWINWAGVDNLYAFGDTAGSVPTQIRGAWQPTGLTTGSTDFPPTCQAHERSVDLGSDVFRCAVKASDPKTDVTLTALIGATFGGAPISGYKVVMVPGTIADSVLREKAGVSLAATPSDGTYKVVAGPTVYERVSGAWVLVSTTGIAACNSGQPLDGCALGFTTATTGRIAVVAQDTSVGNTLTLDSVTLTREHATDGTYHGARKITWLRDLVAEQAIPRIAALVAAAGGDPTGFQAVIAAPPAGESVTYMSSLASAPESLADFPTLLCSAEE